MGREGAGDTRGSHMCLRGTQREEGQGGWGEKGVLGRTGWCRCHIGMCIFSTFTFSHVHKIFQMPYTCAGWDQALV